MATAVTMRYRRLDEDGEPVMGKGRQDFLVDGDAFAQAVCTRLKLYLGEWWEDLNDGLPMFQSMLGVPGTRKEYIDALIAERIIKTKNFKSLQETQSKFSTATRKYEFYSVVNSLFGQTTIASQGVIQR